MNYKKILTLALLTVLVWSCAKGKKTLTSNTLELKGKSFTLKIDKIAKHPKVGYPFNPVDEKEYKNVSKGNEYTVSFSKNGNSITIMPGEIKGKITKIEDKNIKEYELEKGLVANGRFDVWLDNNKLKAEYTIYGSGVPVISSERGLLTEF
ncbi:MAG: hypothetical protein GY810_21445 [Aureispira sp.]|nr:hypothetical protein [Aureispira sp.]